MNKYSLSALAAAGLLAGSLATGANAADLGGNCCADLEERIAELEATTARKGNRKVSLTISGWVAEQVTYWDDGAENNVYVTGLGTTLGSNVKFTGQATIVPGWTAGYVLHLEADGSDALTTNQSTPNGVGLFAGTTNYVQTLQSYWFLKSDHYGKVSVGLQSMVADNAAILVDGSGSLVPANWVAFDVLSFGIRNNAGGFTGATWGTPASVSLATATAFPSTRSVTTRRPSPASRPRLRGVTTTSGMSASVTLANCMASSWQPRLSTQKPPTAACSTLAGVTASTSRLAPTSSTSERASSAWSTTATSRATSLTRPISGTSRLVFVSNWNHLGHTVLYGEYMTSESYITDGDFEWWGLGAVQEIDAAAMSMFLKYRNYSLDGDTGACAAGCEDFDEVTFGALINF